MKRDHAAETALQDIMDARQLGHDYFPEQRELTLVDVARHASTLWPDNKDHQIAFLQGFSRARQLHDERGA